VLGALPQRFPRVGFVAGVEREQGAAYYCGPMIRVVVRTKNGVEVALGDGGEVGWLQGLLGRRDLSLFTSGFGVELLAKLCAPPSLAEKRPPADPHTSLRRATLDDVDRLTAILAQPSVSARWPGYDRAEVRSWLAGGEGEHVEVYAIERAGAVVGAIQIWEQPDPDYRHAGLDLFLDESVRGAGVASAAIEEAVSIAFSRGHHRVVIDPARDNVVARRAYARCGFRVVGVLKRYERGTDGTFHDGVLMERLRT
jgi:aminoglycoside 6'-N-acetyltransferase